MVPPCLFGVCAKNVLDLLVPSMNWLPIVTWVVFSFISLSIHPVSSALVARTLPFLWGPQTTSLSDSSHRPLSLSSPQPWRNFLSSHFPRWGPVSDSVPFSLCPLFPDSPLLFFHFPYGTGSFLSSRKKGSTIFFAKQHRIFSDSPILPRSNSWKGKLSFLSFLSADLIIPWKSDSSYPHHLTETARLKSARTSSFPNPASFTLSFVWNFLRYFTFLFSAVSTPVSLFFLYPLMTTFLSPFPIYEAYNTKQYVYMYICKIYHLCIHTYVKYIKYYILYTHI